MVSGEVDLFLASLKRCLAQQPRFTSHFYDRFIGASDEVREKFKDTDMQRQVRMLEDSLLVVANAVQSKDGSIARGELPRIAARHGRDGLAIRPALYELWADCLVETARECDPAFRDEIEQSWRAVLGFGVQYMIERY